MRKIGLSGSVDVPLITLTDRAREIFQMGLEFFGEEEEQLEKAQGLYSAFAKMETRHKVGRCSAIRSEHDCLTGSQEYERARMIYKVGSRLSIQSSVTF